MKTTAIRLHTFEQLAKISSTTAVVLFLAMQCKQFLAIPRKPLSCCIWGRGKLPRYKAFYRTPKTSPDDSRWSWILPRRNKEVAEVSDWAKCDGMLITN